MKERFIHAFKGFHMHLSQCIVEIRSHEDKTYVCFIDINDGTSVTNASEQLATEIVNDWKLNPRICRFFETYQQYGYETFDEIEYTWFDKKEGWEAKNPMWKRGEDGRKIFNLDEKRNE